ncbi:MAG: bifunctional 4-hydroxy-3-methylbut-2-enyl diphosphate reductase/30S ribosomal protein S1 [Clostridiales bacterium]|jgi:(E)-4-hydroxy-3-methyl-but-2-enyl pyrophosphate reductase|nr:bifunctional 4-hydroxy-3-methylbut-2-enyl diphosphate reductase/30S ribosomal protein S1 [Clostridiales bacterium]
MKIQVAKHAGFCFGVRRATQVAEDALKQKGGAIYTLGRLIHNDGYIAALRQRGMEEISREDVHDICRRARSGEKITVIIRAHGEMQKVLSQLLNCAAEHKSLTVLDCTCPYVTKVRRIAAEYSGAKKLFILIGAADHPEVQGIMSCCKGEGLIFSSAALLEEWIHSPGAEKYKDFQISVAAQTTQNLSEWKKCLKIIKKVYTNALIFDTICNVTEERQTEAEQLADSSDAVIVIGSRGSSNTVKLYEICKKRCHDTYLCENADSTGDLVIPPRCNIISITAGASTPFSVIQEVKQTMSEQMENFAEMLEQTMKTLNPGDIVVGVVTSVSQNEITLDLGTKTTGVIVHDKLTDDPSAKLDEMFKIGDEVRAKVIKISDIEGIATLDKLKVDSEQNWHEIVAKYESGEIVEGKIVDCVKGGLIISIQSVRVFIPASLSGVPKNAGPDALQALVGTMQKVKIIEIKEDRKRAFASIRAVLAEERREKEEAFWNQVEVGQIYEGPVKSLTSYGAFVDLGGVDGMVHTSELSWRRIRHPSEIVSQGDVIKVYVKALDREKGRISLGYKTEDTDPWFIFNQKYNVGDTASVKIVSLMPFGAFAEVVPGADGLIHISQIADHKIETPAEVLKVGDIVDAKVIAIDDENRKISLSMRALLEEKKEAEEQGDAADLEESAVVYSTDNPQSFAEVDAE